ncbi:hypothetical protein SteCoe_17128 [Stentor coeruleus]|uniref:Protein-S-isoprenylcysteine O-methyltransferase n=1 Tax=Stentor coeruleus TaxID=5963 RepID=A0A1R2BZT2_9CILI|nr:hypothetical protein SteCoe_17128 [Stentor coeruleus]
MENSSKEDGLWFWISERKHFFVCVLASFLALVSFWGIGFVIIFIYADFCKYRDIKHCLSVTFLVAFGLISLPLYSCFTLENDTWSLALKCYLISLILFHIGEFYVQSYFHYKEANFSTFLLDHSKDYTIAITASFSEHLSKLILPYPSFIWICIFGIIITSIGHIFRIGSEINCGQNFSHRIKYSKKASHVLVTNGFYKLCRHPSYFGWFLWSVGTQIMLGNIICTIGFYWASVHFFRNRLSYEEPLLVEFFRNDYVKYIKNTSQFFPGWRNFLEEEV